MWGKLCVAFPSVGLSSLCLLLAYGYFWGVRYASWKHRQEPGLGKSIGSTEIDPELYFFRR